MPPQSYLNKGLYFKNISKKGVLTAIEIAISDSVTVSMGDETRGALREIFFVKGEDRSTVSAVKSIKPGNKRKSLFGRIMKKRVNYQLHVFFNLNLLVGDSFSSDKQFID